MLHWIHMDKSNLIAARMAGRITKEDVVNVHAQIDSILKKRENVDFYFEMENLKGYELMGLWEDLKVDIKTPLGFWQNSFCGEQQLAEMGSQCNGFFH